jgi:CheY-like chemotaxis protein
VISQGTDASTRARRAKKPFRVLVVDDDVAMCTLLCEALVDDDYDVLVAGDGNEALAVVRDEDSGADVVVMDHRMPNTTGLEAVALLRAENSWTPVIIVSAFANAAMVDEARALGVHRVLQKPLSLALLLSTLREILPRRAT